MPGGEVQFRFEPAILFRGQGLTVAANDVEAEWLIALQVVCDATVNTAAILDGCVGEVIRCFTVLSRT